MKRGFGVAAVTLGVGFVLRLITGSSADSTGPFIAMLAWISAAAWYAGIAAGLLATAAASAAALYLFVPPIYSFGGEWGLVAWFAAEGAAASILCGARSRRIATAAPVESAFELGRDDDADAVDSGAVLDAVLRTYNDRPATRSEMPIVTIDRASLERVFTLLLRGVREHQSVHISGGRQGSGWLFWMCGAGDIAEARRIVESLGGRMWIDQAGAVVRFHVPRRGVKSSSSPSTVHLISR